MDHTVRKSFCINKYEWRKMIVHVKTRLRFVAVIVQLGGFECKQIGRMEVFVEMIIGQVTCVEML